MRADVQLLEPLTEMEIQYTNLLHLRRWLWRPGLVFLPLSRLSGLKVAFVPKSLQARYGFFQPYGVFKCDFEISNNWHNVFLK